MTTITGNARFRDSVAARLVRAFRPTGALVDEATPAQSGTPPGDYSITVDTHEVILQAHAFDPEQLTGPWRASTVYAVGDIALQTSTDADSLVLECTAVSGSAESGASEPTWDTTVGNTTTDNEVTWTTLGTVAELTPLTQWHYQAVLLASIDPATGDPSGGTTVTLTGAGFSAFAAGDDITFGGTSATNITVVSDTEITCDTPAGTEGAADVVVTVSGESATLSGGFEYIAASVFWSHEFTSPGAAISSFNQRLGYRFQVGAADITANALSYYGGDTNSESVRIHRVSDGALIAEADLTPIEGSWVDAPVSQFILQAGVEYTISHRASGSTRRVYRNPSGVTLYGGITKTATVYGTSDGLPTEETSNDYMAARFGFAE